MSHGLYSLLQWSIITDRNILNIKSFPRYLPGCQISNNIPVMEFIYPTSGIRIFIPRDQTGQQTRIIPELAHRNPSKKIFWHLDETYIGTTRYIHEIEIIARCRKSSAYCNG